MRLYLILIVTFFSISTVFAQKVQKVTLETLDGVDIDGNLDEWPPLIDVAGEGLWCYQLVNSADHIHLAVRVMDPLLQQMAAQNGIVFSVVSQKKSKSDAQLIFPFPDGEVKRAMRDGDADPNQDNKEAFIERSRGYYVQGFLDIPNGLLSLQNSYGVQAKAKVLAGGLAYEARIPKRALEENKKPLILKIGINDGFSYLPVAKNRATPARRSYGYQRPAATKSKSKQTLVVLLETTIH